MEKLKYIVIGGGIRAHTYAEQAGLSGKFEMVGVAEPDDFLRNELRELYNVPEDKCFRSYEEILAMEANGHIIPEEILQWAHAQQQSDMPLRKDRMS